MVDILVELDMAAASRQSPQLRDGLELGLTEVESRARRGLVKSRSRLDAGWWNVAMGAWSDMQGERGRASKERYGQGGVDVIPCQCRGLTKESCVVILLPVYMVCRSE